MKALGPFRPRWAASVKAFTCVTPGPAHLPHVDEDVLAQSALGGALCAGRCQREEGPKELGLRWGQPAA